MEQRDNASGPAASIPLFKVLNQTLAVLAESKAKSVKVSFNQDYQTSASEEAEDQGNN